VAPELCEGHEVVFASVEEETFGDNLLYELAKTLEELNRAV